jgi:adenosylhomocysteine nucleosidase
MIAVTFALESESSEFIRLLSEAHRAPGEHTVGGVLNGQNVTVLHTGVGQFVATARVTEFLGRVEPQALLSAGFAGGLTDSCKPSDVIIAENFSAGELHIRAQQLLPAAVSGTLKTTSAIIDSMSSRSELARTHAADAVDMETEFIAQACAAKDIPMLSLRVMSDTPSHPFPAPPDVLFDIERQRTNLGRIAFYIATHPAALPKFIRFARQIKLARAALTDAVATLVTSTLCS